MTYLKENWLKLVFLGLRILFGILLIAAAVDKLIHPYDFAQMVSNYQVPVLTIGISRWVAIWLPYVEIVVGLFLIFGIWLDASVVINLILLVNFTTLVTQAYFRGLDISCGCFSVDEEASSIGIAKILENFALTALSVWMVWMVFKNKLGEVFSLPLFRSK